MLSDLCNLANILLNILMVNWLVLALDIRGVKAGCARRDGTPTVNIEDRWDPCKSRAPYIRMQPLWIWLWSGSLCNGWISLDPNSITLQVESGFRCVHTTHRFWNFNDGNPIVKQFGNHVVMSVNFAQSKTTFWMFFSRWEIGIWSCSQCKQMYHTDRIY